MAERVTKAQRVTLHHRAEVEVMRYAGDHAAWHKHVHNVDLDPAQVLKCLEMDQHLNTLDFSCRRTGKTAIKELYLLHHNATQADQELGIVAPREAQSLVNLGYHLDAIRRSPILTAWLNFKSGRVQLADTFYQFANRSQTRAYGIMAQVDGGDLTAASLEEVDDMPHDRLFSRFLLMMGASRRLGASEDSTNNPQIRITGVFKGADTLTELVRGGHYAILPTVNVYLGIELGILNEAFMLEMQTQLSPDEYIRQLLCRNVSAKNLVHEAKVRRALQVGLKAGLAFAPPDPFGEYKKRGLLTFGYDAGGHGESDTASKHALVVLEQIGIFTCLVYCRTWPAAEDDQVVKRDLLSAWRYFRPDYAIGDAYGVGMLTALNDDLFTEGLTTINRQAIADGASSASAWTDWAFSPLRFEGMVKHQMAQAVRSIFHQDRAAIPYFDDHDLLDPELETLRAFVRQIPNIRPAATKASYNSYQMANRKIGDDLFDALMAAVWAMVTRGAAAPPAAILTQTQTRQALLGTAA